MLRIVFQGVFSLITKFLPGVILKKFINADKVSKDIEIDLRSISPLNIELNRTIPEVLIWFKITNKSSLPITLDRVINDVWLGQPIAYGFILDKVEILPKQSKENIVFKYMLSELQRSEIKIRLDRETSPITVNLNSSFYFECKLGNFKKDIHKEYPLHYNKG